MAKTLSVYASFKCADGNVRAGHKEVTAFEVSDAMRKAGVTEADANGINRSRTLDAQAALRRSIAAKYDGKKISAGRAKPENAEEF